MCISGQNFQLQEKITAEHNISLIPHKKTSLQISPEVRESKIFERLT